MDDKESIRATLRRLVGLPGTRVRFTSGQVLTGTIDQVDHRCFWISIMMPAGPGQQMRPIGDVAEVGTP